jgi:hypothetical protein
VSLQVSAPRFKRRVEQMGDAARLAAHDRSTESPSVLAAAVRGARLGQPNFTGTPLRCGLRPTGRCRTRPGVSP